MSTRLLRFPETVKETLIRRYQNQHRNWLIGQGQWPLILPLGCPKEEDAIQQLDVVRRWTSAWQVWKGPGEVIWDEKRWRSLGTQLLPGRIVINEASAVATWLGEESRWQRAQSRYFHLVTRWPALASNLHRHFNVLADYSNDDIQRLEDMLHWLITNPDSRLYTRQIPIAGIHSKWLGGRYGVIAELVAALKGYVSEGLDFHQCCGLRKPSHVIRIRILDSCLKKHFSGLGDISVPLDELAKLDVPISNVFIVENLQSGLSFNDLSGSIVLMGMGNSITLIERLAWLANTNCLYWGDIDTYGFSILNQARSCLPHIKSILMDEATLLKYEALRGNENNQYSASELPMLTDSEQTVYRGLKEQRWGVNLRLEQERIPWDYAWAALSGAL